MKTIRIAALVMLLVAEASGCNCSTKDKCAGVVCTASDQCHAAGACAPETGQCSNPAKVDGAACSDGNPCTQNDTCKAGVCTAGPAVVCAARDACHTAGACDPTSGACSNPPAADGTTCSTGSGCSTGDTCKAGACKPGGAVADGTACDDHNTCTSGDACKAGVCAGTAVADGTGCDDNNACTLTDTCQAGVCTGANPVVCGATDQCHATGACDPSSGTCSNPNAPDGQSCSVGDVSNEFCTAGVCACPHGDVICSHACVDTTSDPNNCGACNFHCSTATGQTCQKSHCVGGCVPGLIACGAACVNASTDPNNCGSCGNACGPTQVCSAGACQDACGAGLTACSAACVDTSSDLHNCGKCGNACGAAQICANGTCASRAVASSCLPTSSIGVDVGSTKVTAYVPNGAWSKTSNSNRGVQVVPVEGGGSRATIATADAVNSCASNSSTHQTVCVANGTDVYVVAGSTIVNTMTSAGKGQLNFTGGSCTTCGVAIDGLNNIAWLAIANGGTDVGGFQAIDLSGGSIFGGATVVPAGGDTSEDIAVDPLRHLLLSPNEAANYQLVNTRTNAVYDYFINGAGEDFDSAAEDCTTGIALTTSEFTGLMILVDLTQATFTKGTPRGTWSAPTTVSNFPEFASLGAGTSGVVVPPGAHLAMVTGEFGGDLVGAMRLPSTSGSGSPVAPDYVAMHIPKAPDGTFFEMGMDPHTATAYISPNTGRAFGLLANGDGVNPTWLAIIDIEAMLSAPRLGHTVDTSYDLVAHGVVSFISVQ